jgi:hypothetical protein
VTEVDWLIWFVPTSTLRETEIVKMVPNIEIPESRLAIVVHASTDVTGLRIV